MDATRARQKALDDELVTLADLALDALKLTPFYNAFEISADVPKIYIDMLKICPKLPGQIFKEPPLEEEILSFIRDLGHTGEIKFLSDVNVNHMHQPWRSFSAIINKCLSGKTTALENLVFQVENKNSKKNNDMYYPRFTKVIVDYFMAKDQAIPRRNKMFWHHTRDYFMFTTTLKRKTTKKKADSKASPKTKTTQATKGKRIKSSAKGDKAAKKKQPAETSMDKGLTVLSDVALTEAEQLKLVIKRSKTQSHSSYVSGSVADEGTGNIPGVPDVPTYGSDDEQISWKSSEEDDEDEVNVSEKDDDDDEQIDSDTDGDDFVHPKFLTYDDEARKEEVNKEDSFDLRVQKPSHDESTDDDNSDEEVQGTNTEEEEMGRDNVITDFPLHNVQVTQETEDTHVILTALINPKGQQQSSSLSSSFVSNMLNPRTDTGIDSIFNTEATSLVDVSVTMIVEPPLVSATTLPSPPTPLITHMQQTLVPTPTTILSSSLQNLPNFGSLFGIDHRLKTLETYFSEFKQTNQFAKVVSSIPSIVDNYLANKMNEAIKTVVQLQSDRLQEEAQAKNEDFLNKHDDNIKKIIKEQVKEQVKAQTSLAISANLSELELKNILIKKMESNKSINRSNEQKNLYKALVKPYKSDKLIIDTYGDIGSFKRSRDNEDKDEEPSEKISKTTGKSTDGSKSQHKSAGESAHTEEPMHTDKDLEEPAHQEFDIGATEEQSDEETSQHPDWFQKLAKIPSSDHDWNKTLPAAHGPVQP
ncbi:hypothetical protein Tco_1548044 [Tanacetum coccineum]